MYLQLFCAFALIFAMKVDGNLRLNAQNSSLSRQNTNRCDLTAHPQCSRDCSTILLCFAGIENPIYSIKCASNTPYCDNGLCSAAPGNCSLNSMNSSFLCTSAGIFPEPSNCTKYHHCSEGGLTSIPYQCPAGFIFNSKLKLCVKADDRRDEKLCRPFSCDNVTNDFILFPANPAYYAYCFESVAGVRYTYMYKCNDDANKVFDMKTKLCRFKCKSRGYFADPLDCSAYYICNGPHSSSRHVNCPTNYYFNGTVCRNSAEHCPSGSIVDISTTTTTSTTSTTTSTPTTTIDVSTITTTSIPATTTSIPATTTRIPTTTTSIPTTRTSIPTTTTSIPITTTSIPITTTSIPITTTSIPITTTSIPITTTNIPTTTTSIPTTTTSIPITTTSIPTTTTSIPTTRTSIPTTTTSIPITTTSIPITTTSIPTTTTSIPTTTTSIPITTTSIPITTSSIPTTTTSIQTTTIDDSITTTTSTTTTTVEDSATKTSDGSDITTTTTSSTTEDTVTGMMDPISLQNGPVTSIPSKPPSIWKHNGRFSVRIGRFLNLI